MKRVVVVARERVGPEMAGPGIRSVEFARELTRRGHDVTLVTPGATGPLELPYAVAEGADVGEAAADADVVVAQHLGISQMLRLARRDTRTVYDLYVPFVTENLPLHASERTNAARDDVYRTTNLVQQTALAVGDAFVCASERQRDLWLGALGTLGRVDVRAYERDPSLRRLIDVVPFGIDPQEPVRTRRAIKGVVEGIAADDKVLLWAGGIWNWFDPLTVIRAVDRLRSRRDDVRLFFLAGDGFAGGPPAMAMARRARQLSDELGLTGRAVFFNEHWVPYEDRANYLLDADLGVSAHHDDVESRFAYRTRILDHFWARLPSIVTSGDTLAETVAARGLGTVVPAGDVDAWAEAIERLLDDDAARSRAVASCESVRAELAWPVVVEPLAQLIEDEGAAAPLRAAATRLAFDYVGRGAVAAVKNRRLAAEWWRRRA